MSPYQRGQLSGFVLGKYRVEFAICTGASKLILLAHNLKRTDRILTIERLATARAEKAVVTEIAAARIVAVKCLLAASK